MTAPEVDDDDAVEIALEDFYEECRIVTAQAEAEKAKAEAEMAKWVAASAKLAYTQDLINHRHQMDGVYTFNRFVNRKSAEGLMNAMHIWHAEDPAAPWTIYLNSVGGELIHGNALIDELVAHSIRGGGTHHVTIKVRGLAASMAGMILQAGDSRLMGANSELMIHAGSGGVHGTYYDLKDEVQYHDRLMDAMVKWFLSRTDKITADQLLEKIDRRDWWMPADEAIKWGFADGIG